MPGAGYLRAAVSVETLSPEAANVNGRAYLEGALQRINHIGRI